LLRRRLSTVLTSCLESILRELTVEKLLIKQRSGIWFVQERRLWPSSRQSATDEGCRDYLRRLRWSETFPLPALRSEQGWAAVERGQCAGCGRRSSVTAGRPSKECGCDVSFRQGCVGPWIHDFFWARRRRTEVRPIWSLRAISDLLIPCRRVHGRVLCRFRQSVA
jgi:hypothetical protein